MRNRLSLLRQGVTLVELMVMSVIASLVALTVIQGFSGISRGIISTRFKTIAVQLAHEKMQSLKSTPYYRLRVSSQTVIPSALSGLSPSIRSDALNYPPTNSVISKTVFTDYTVVERVKKISGTETLEIRAWDAPDTGLKQLTLNIVWQENGALKKFQLTNLLENQDRSLSSGDFVGKVRNTAWTPLVDATVAIMDNASFVDTTDGGGDYRIGVPAGTYAIRAFKRGFFESVSPYYSISSTLPQVTADFTLLAMSSGTVSGTVWHNDHLVISRVCGAKMDGGTSQEYVEIFNPTTWTWMVDGQIGLSFQRTAAQDPVAIPIQMDYTVGGNAIAPGKFFLFGSHAEGLTIDGVFVGPDAGWADGVGAPNDVNFPYFDAINGLKNILPINGTDGPTEGAGVLSLYVLATGAVIDKIGWKGGAGFNPGSSETAPVPGATGMEVNKIYYRKSDVGGSFSSTIGPAYDSGNNALDWGVDSGAPHTLPRTTVSAALPIRTGTPSHGAFVFTDDGLSQMVQATLTGSPPEARFTLPAIATGTWTVSASSGNFYMGFSTSITAGVAISTSLVMNTSTIYGFVAGRVLDAVTTAGIPGISISPGGGVTNAGGNYNVALLPGDQTVTANLGGANPAFTSDSKPVTVSLGQIAADTFFHLSKGAKIQGRVTLDGTNPLPDVPIAITNIVTGYAADNTTSDPQGNFMVSVPTGTYSVQPTAAFGESVTPIIGNLNVLNGGTTVFSATFTVSSAFGSLAGSVTSGGNPIGTGVLIVASTSAIPATLPDIDASFRASPNVFYTGCSRPDGTYTISLRNGIYFVSAWFTTFNGNTPTVIRLDHTAVIIQPKLKTVLDLTW